MDALIGVFAELWWTVPAVMAGGTATVFVARKTRGGNGRARRLEVTAALHEVERAQTRVAEARASVARTRADYMAIKAQRDYPAMVQAKLAQRDARRELRAAQADIRARRARVQAARVALRTIPRNEPREYPLGRVLVAHDQVVSRWMEYETDVAKQIAFPAMTDARVPLTAAFLDASHVARALRPAGPTARVSPDHFLKYRESVAALAEAFESAEKEAWRIARAEERRSRVSRPTAPPVPLGPSTPPPASEAPGLTPRTAPPRDSSIWPVPSRRPAP